MNTAGRILVCTVIYLYLLVATPILVLISLALMWVTHDPNVVYRNDDTLDVSNGGERGVEHADKHQ